MDCSPPGYSVHGVLQASILDWAIVSPSMDLPDPGIEPMSLMSPALTGRFFTTSTTWEAPDSVHYSVIHCLSMYDLITIAVKAVLRFLLL